MSESEIGIGIDTSGNMCSIALQRGDLLLAETRFRHEMHLSERLIGDLDGLLKSFNFKLSDVDYFTVSLGPGSFTGVRIGVTTVKIFAETLEAPIYGFNSLEAVASDFLPLADAVLALISSRKKEVYAALFTGSLDAIQPIMPPAVFDVDELARHKLLQGFQSIIGAGEGVALLSNALSEQNSDLPIRVAGPSPSLASQALRLAHAKRQGGDLNGDDPAMLIPLYLAPPPISQPKAGPFVVND